MFGGALQMYLGQPDTTPRLDNVHRFMAAVYLSTGFISFWAAVTIRRQGTLVFLLALGVFLRLVSIGQVGLPEPAAVWRLSHSRAALAHRHHGGTRRHPATALVGCA